MNKKKFYKKRRKIRKMNNNRRIKMKNYQPNQRNQEMAVIALILLIDILFCQSLTKRNKINKRDESKFA